MKLQVWGARTNGDVQLNLPAFKNNIASVDAGTADNEKGLVTLSPTMTSVTVKLKRPPSEM